MSKPDGGPAFGSGMMPHPTDDTKVVPIAQLTVRDWFAGQALVGLCREPPNDHHIAEWAYALADAMLTERSKP